MKITLHNFGIIKTFHFDIKDNFSLIFGKNNTGKSYAISAIYLIIKNFLKMKMDILLFRYIFSDGDIVKKIDEIFKKCEKELLIKGDIEEILKQILTNIFIKELEESFQNSFDSIENLNNKLSNKPLKIEIKTELLDFEIAIKEKHFYISHLIINKEKIILKKSKRNLKPKDKNSILTIYITDNYENIFNFILELIQSLTKEIKKEIKNIYYLPASRSGLYQALSAFGQIIAELSKNRSFITKRIELPTISEPLSDYFLELSNIKNKKLIDNEIEKIAKNIEKNILNGEIEFDNKTKKILFKPNNTDLKLDLSYTSSMVSEISPIVSYLKFIINQPVLRKEFPNSKPLIMIEEPEAHLHPEIQIKLLEEFINLTNNGVKFIITTHSNYIFNKFNNLILAKKVDISKTKSFLFQLTNQGTEVKNLEIDEFGVEDENFIYTSEKLYNEKMKLVEKYNNV